MREKGKEEETRTYEFLPPLQPAIDLILVEDMPTGKDPNDFAFLEVLEADRALRRRNQRDEGSGRESAISKGFSVPAGSEKLENEKR